MTQKPSRIFEIVSDEQHCLPLGQKGQFVLAYSRPTGQPFCCIVTDGNGDMIDNSHASYPLTHEEVSRHSRAGGCLSERNSLPMPKAHEPAPVYVG